ncbi:MAG: hypothetical protein O7E52_06775 [Candidatus Poribacteria bacterium]|nr:hypothetical protein [Candidatus Poribacteria bacterium]
MRNVRWSHNRALLLEIFILANLAFLALDVFIAHSVNAFAHRGEWVPFIFSLVAPVVLLLILLRRHDDFQQGIKRLVGLCVGWGAILVGIVGLLFHLESQFFSDMTIKNLVYTAPFVAPLAFTGLGLLLVMNRTVPVESMEWGKWVVFMTLGGFAGNFVLSLCDHAQNGFFDAREWIPIFTSAIAIGFLISAVLQTGEPPFMRQCLTVLVFNGLVGGVGFYFHFVANLHGVSSNIKDNFLYGAPVFAPLLFPNLALLGALGIWALTVKAEANAPT